VGCGATTRTINTNTKISNISHKEEKPRLQTRGLGQDPKLALIPCCSLHVSFREKVEAHFCYVAYLTHLIIYVLINITMTKIPQP
jgi:hypothetical protein